MGEGRPAFAQHRGENSTAIPDSEVALRESLIREQIDESASVSRNTGLKYKDAITDRECGLPN